MEESKLMQEADKYMEMAKAELSKSNWWFNRIDEIKAIDLMEKASVSYSLAQNNIKSIDALIQVLEVISKSQNPKLKYKMLNIPLLYLYACNKNKVMIQHFVIDLVNDKIIPYLQEDRMFHKIVDLFSEIAMNNEIFNNNHDAMKYYQYALTYSKMSIKKTSNIKILQKIAELNIRVNNDFNSASENYLECAKFALENSLLKFGVKYYLLYSLILMLDTKTEQQIKEKINEYITIYPIFANSPEYNLINELIESYKVKNIKFIKQVIISNSQSFDTPIIKFLEQIKNKLDNYSFL